MYVSSIRLHCRKCHNIFDGEVVNNAPFNVAVASMRALWCPECGATARDLSIVTNEDRLRESLEMKGSGSDA